MLIGVTRIFAAGEGGDGVMEGRLECTHSRDVILRFGVLKGDGVWRGGYVPSRKIFLVFFRVDVVYSSLFIMNNACNSRMI